MLIVSPVKSMVLILLMMKIDDVRWWIESPIVCSRKTEEVIRLIKLFFQSYERGCALVL